MTESHVKSLSAENTFDRDTSEPGAVEALIRELCLQVSSELEKRELRARTIVLKVRLADFSTFTRQVTLKVPVADSADILACAQQLLQDHWDGRRLIRLIGIGAHNLVEASVGEQMGFPID